MHMNDGRVVSNFILQALQNESITVSDVTPVVLQRSLVVRWVVGSILHGGHIELFLRDWCNKGCYMCYPVFGMVHIKEPLLLIGKSSPCGGSRFPLSLSEWSLTICLTPYNRK